MALLQKVYGVAEPDKYIEFEVPVKLSHTSFIDGLIKSTRVLIEQKGQEIDLYRGYRQSDGSMLTPYRQARRYAGYLPHDQNPRWIVVCNFREFHIHDMNRPNDVPEVLLLSDLEKEYGRLNFLVDTGDENIKREMEISMKAGDLVGRLYDAFLRQYKDAANERTLKSLNMLCVRLVFCLYAEDAGIFGRRSIYVDGRAQAASNINAYLIDAENVFVESRSKPICDVPEIGIGNKPIDGGNYLFTKEEKDAFLKKEPEAASWFKLWYGSQEFINRSPRYCLWLGECPPNILRQLPECRKRVEAVREFRLSSKSAGTVKLADTPTRFHVENMPKSPYILVPEVSSERRRYIPMGFMTPDVLCSNLVKVIPDAGLYHFGILTSNVHMAWMRVVCGRLKSDYRYSKDIVYNNFPWPTPTDAQKAKIEQTAQAILDARALYPDCSLADLYDEAAMPPELRKAHQQNDKAVMEAYGLPVRGTTEANCVAELMRRYQALTKETI